MLSIALLTIAILAAVLLATRGTQALAPAPVVIRVEDKQSHLG